MKTLLLLILLTGCKSEHQRRLEYVRDPAHHCRVEVVHPPYKEWDFNSGGTKQEPGFTSYQCDEGVWLPFNEGEEKP